MNNERKSLIASAMRDINKTALLGLDGMIDEVWELVDSRTSPTEFEKITNMKNFGTAITDRGTGGIAKERVLKRRSCGGFVANTGRAVARFGTVDTTFLGMFGEEPRDVLFDEFKGYANLISLGNPANIQILEFVDGKIMMANLQELLNLKWIDMEQKLGKEQLTEILNKDIIGLGYWSNMYDFENILTEMVEICKDNGKTKRIFHDFANLNKRTPEALLEALAKMKELNAKMPQTLSLNEHEGGILAKVLGVSYPENINDPASMQAALAAVTAMQEKIGIDELVIHTLFFAVGATNNEGVAAVKQNYCENPVKTTGAGDTFNGGYMVVSLTDLPLADRLAVANITTRHYVATGNPPTTQQFVTELDNFDLD